MTQRTEAFAAHRRRAIIDRIRVTAYERCTTRSLPFQIAYDETGALRAHPATAPLPHGWVQLMRSKDAPVPVPEMMTEAGAVRVVDEMFLLDRYVIGVKALRVPEYAEDE